ncbi:uncharacterized protein LOC135384714 [Ornithodoros turicata]|uniref:uncharacterized protein LOC135384714 n=1 Tax=Ornithodoros turicata TaxID=34597 RepID=UPI0031386625
MVDDRVLYRAGPIGYPTETLIGRPPDCKIRKKVCSQGRRTDVNETFTNIPGISKCQIQFFPRISLGHIWFTGLLQPLYAVLGADHPKQATAAPLKWTPAAERAFAEVKQALADAVLLHHPRPDGETALFIDASTAAVGAVLQQCQDGHWKPFSFFTQRLSPAETCYSTFGHELIAAYLAYTHYHHFLDGCPFVLYTDHKPLMFALRSASGNQSTHETRHMCYILEFTTDLRYVDGEDNAAADALSRPDVNALHPPPAVNLDGITQAEQADQVLADLHSSPVSLPSSTARLWCDTSTGTPRPFVPLDFRRPVFNGLHSLPHPGVRGTQNIIAERYIWPQMNADVRAGARAYLACQRSKIQRHTTSPSSWFLPPDAHFDQVHMDLVGPLPPAKGYRYLLSCIDRFTRWPEVIPIPDIMAETVAHAFVFSWVSRFGVLSTVTTDRGRQSESAVFCHLCSALGTHRIRTMASMRLPTAWSSAFIGNSRLPSAPLTTATQHCPSVFPSSCLAIAPRSTRTASAHMVYGCALRLPGAFFTASAPLLRDTS